MCDLILMGIHMGNEDPILKEIIFGPLVIRKWSKKWQNWPNLAILSISYYPLYGCLSREI